MTIEIQRPGGGSDLSRANKRGCVYVISEDSTGEKDGDIRFKFNPEIDGVQLERNENDEVWNLDSLEVNDESINLGRDLKIGATSGQIETISLSAPSGYQRAILPSTEFDESGTNFPMTPALSALADEDLNVGPAVSQKTGTVIGQVINVVNAVAIDNAEFLVGTIAPTSAVNLKFYTGTDNTGTNFFSRNFGSSEFTASQPWPVDFSDSFGFDGIGSYYLEFTSSSNMSFQTDAFNILVSTFSRHLLKQQTVMTTDDLILSNDLSFLFDNNLDLVVAVPFNI